MYNPYMDVQQPFLRTGKPGHHQSSQQHSQRNFRQNKATLNRVHRNVESQSLFGNQTEEVHLFNCWRHYRLETHRKQDILSRYS